MPQNKVTIGPRVINKFDVNKYALLAKKLKEAVIKAYNVPENDVAFTAIAALFVEGEADVQVETNCTAGKDEYNRGKPFDPSEDEQEVLCNLIKIAFDEFCAEQDMPAMSLSVWPIPHYNTKFVFFPKVEASIT